MVDLSRLEKILDVSISEVISRVNLFYREGDDVTIEDNRTYNINLAEVTPEQRRRLIEIPDAHVDEEGRLLRSPVEEETEDIEQAWKPEYDEIIDFFDDLIFDRYVSIIRKSLYLRGVLEVENLSKEQIDKRKRDIAEHLGGEAFYMTNLCTAGYFDEGRIFRDMYFDMFYEGEYEAYKFKDFFQDIVQERTLCVFVERDQTTYEVVQDIKGRIAKWQRQRPPFSFIDVRGIGDECKGLIEDAIQRIDEEYISFDYTPYNDTEGHYVVRINPAAMESLGESYS